jgi:hypothetical protein
MNATIAPSPMLACIALVCANPSTHGEATNQKPSKRLSHSSQYENATMAAIDIAAIAAPLAQRSSRAFLLAYEPRRHKQENTERCSVEIEYEWAAPSHRDILRLCGLSVQAVR